MNVRTLHVVAPVVLALTGTAGCTANEAAPAPAPPPTVPVVQVAPERVTVASEWITTLDGQVNAQVRPQVSGYLVRRRYQEGSYVRKGAVLFEIDPRPFTVGLAQAEARLAEAQAQLGRAERDVERNTPLARERAIAQSQLDNDVQAQLAARAGVQAAEAAVDAAKLNLEFTQVRSLVDGVAAIATAQIGDLVSPQTLLTTVSQVDPIRAYFSLSEREYLALAVQINAKAGGRRLWTGSDGLRLTLADGSVYPRPGVFQAADRQIDPKTGTMRVSVLFPNPDHVLRPGQYGRVSADTRTVEQALLVPQRAVTETQGGMQVRLVGADDRVQVRPVQTGARIGARWIVESGLQAGDRVIVDAGQLAAGLIVKTKPYTDPAANATALTQTPPPAAATTGAPSRAPREGR